jgi:hypothetical protein
MEQRLKQEAARQGLNESEYARRVLERNLPRATGTIDQPTLDLFAQWDREDQTDDPLEIERRNREFEELKESLNRNRLESGGPNARKIFP